MTGQQTHDYMLRLQVTRDLLATLNIVAEVLYENPEGLDRHQVHELAIRVGKAIAREQQQQRQQLQTGKLGGAG